MGFRQNTWKVEPSRGEQARFSTQVSNQIRRTNPMEAAKLKAIKQKVKNQEHIPFQGTKAGTSNSEVQLKSGNTRMDTKKNA